jgi:hypothetical protein
MARGTVYVIQSSMDRTVSVRRRAAGSPARIHHRFTRGGKFFSCEVQGSLLVGGRRVTKYRTMYGFGTNQIAWYDWYEA